MFWRKKKNWHDSLTAKEITGEVKVSLNDARRILAQMSDDRMKLQWWLGVLFGFSLGVTATCFTIWILATILGGK